MAFVPPDYAKKKDYVQSWVDEDSKLSLTGSTRDPNAATPEARSGVKDSESSVSFSQTRTSSQSASKCTLRLDDFHSTCERVLTNTGHMITEMQSGTIKKIAEAEHALDELSRIAEQDLALVGEEQRAQKDNAHRLSEENRYLQSELVAARASIDRIFHSVFNKSGDMKELTPESMILKITKKVRSMESTKRDYAEKLRAATKERDEALVKTDHLQREIKSLRGSELKLRNTVSTQKARMDSYKQTIKEVDESKSKLQAKVDGLEMRNDSLTKEKEALASRIQEQKAHSVQNNAKLEQMQSILRAAQKKRNLTENALETAENQIQALSEKLLDQAAHASESAQMRAGLEKEKELLRASFDKAMESEEKLRRDLEQATNESSAKRYRVHELRAALADMKTKKESIEYENVQLKEENIKLRSDITQSKSTILDHEEEIEQMKAQADNLKSLLPTQVENLTSYFGMLYANLETKLQEKERHLLQTCSKLSNTLSQYQERAYCTSVQHDKVEAQLVLCLNLLGQNISMPKPGVPKKNSAIKRILNHLGYLTVCLEDKMGSYKNLTDTSRCLETNMVEAQNEIESLKALLQKKESAVRENEGKVDSLEKEITALKGNALGHRTIIESIKNSIYKRSSGSLDVPKESNLEQNSHQELLIAVKFLLEELENGVWDRECAQEDLKSKQEGLRRLEYKVAAYSAALQFNSRKLEDSESQSEAFEVKKREMLCRNEELLSELELKEGRLNKVEERIRRIESVNCAQSETLGELGQVSDIQLYKISSSFRCLDDIEVNILRSFETFQECLSSKEDEVDKVLQDLQKYFSRSGELEKENCLLAKMLKATRSDQQIWKEKYRYINKMIGVYLPKFKAKMRGSKLAKLQVVAAKKRNRLLRKQMQCLKKVEVSKLHKVKEKIISNVRRELQKEKSYRSAMFAARTWHLSWKNARKMEALAISLMKETQEKKRALTCLQNSEQENKSLAASLGKQSEMLRHLQELESFLQHSKETIQRLQLSEGQKGQIIKELKLSKNSLESSQLENQEKARFLEAQLLKTQEDLVVMQNQFAVTTKEHLRLIEKYTTLQSTMNSLKEESESVQDRLEFERSSYSEQQEENASIRKELQAKERRLRELRNALSSVCAEKHKAEEELELSKENLSNADACHKPQKSNAGCQTQIMSDRTNSKPSSASVALQTGKEFLGLRESEELEAQAEILLLQSEMEGLKGLLQKSEKTALEKEERLSSLQTKVSTLEREIQNKEGSLTRLQEMLDKTLESLAESTQEMLASSDQLDKVQVSEQATSSTELRAVEGIIATWREACDKRDREIEVLRSKLEVFAAHFSQVANQRDYALMCEAERDESKEQAQAMEQKLSKSYSDLKSLQQDLERNKRRLEQVQSSSQRALGVLNRALSGWCGSSSLTDDIEEASHDISKLISKLGEEAETIKQKQVRYKSSAKENSDHAASLQVQSIALQKSVEVKEKRIKDLKRENLRLEEKARSLDSKQSLLDSYQCKLNKTQCDLSSAQSKIEQQSRDMKELNKMLKAWEAMRNCKDTQINSLLEKCKRYEQEVAAKSRSVDALRRKIAARAAHTHHDLSSANTTTTSLKPASFSPTKTAEKSPRTSRRASEILQNSTNLVQ